MLPEINVKKILFHEKSFLTRKSSKKGLYVDFIVICFSYSPKLLSSCTIILV